MDRIGNIIEEFIRVTGIEKPIKRYRALQIWPKVVGKKIARMTDPVRIEQSRIFVRVKNDAWRHELIYHKPEIIRKLNIELGSDTIDDIILL